MNFYELRSEEETFGWAPIRRCLVCNYKALHKNYGVLSCNGCSGFFRRSIKSARSYVCLRGKNCSITYGNHKRTCQYCRFKKCCDAGMSIDFVIARHNDLETTLPLANSENSFFTRLTDSFNSAFVQRFRSLSRHPKRPQNGSLSWHRQQFKAEFEIVMHYLKYTGIRDLLNNESEAVLLTTNFLSQWIFLSCCWNTLRHRGFCHNQYFFVDEIQIKVTLEDEQAYLEREPTPDLRNVPFLAHTLLDLHISTLEKIKRFHDCDFDLSDLAFYLSDNHIENSHLVVSVQKGAACSTE
ncbi:hypothetical protein M3Y94_00093900 [Aphelenchoides besseyi]|nr:hypothetical protein M3Y94_00093900 [Aphelenchoides besseyi]